jgi:hypothetical protein
MDEVLVAAIVEQASDRGPASVVRRTQLLQELAEELPWFTFVIYRRGDRAPFVVDFGCGPLALTLSQVDMFVVGLRAANAHHTGGQQDLAAITATRPTRQLLGSNHGH